MVYARSRKNAAASVNLTRPRSRCGAVLVESVAGLYLLAVAAVLLITLITGAGTYAYYLIAVRDAAQQGASFATESAEWLGQPRQNFATTERVNSVVSGVLTGLGLAGTPAVKVTDRSEGGERFKDVEVSKPTPLNNRGNLAFNSSCDRERIVCILRDITARPL